ncbi:cytochrome P450 [Daedaleopsis nitida]|nr:cytochrome P450 [Daedaleopsis nitida]
MASTTLQEGALVFLAGVVLVFLIRGIRRAVVSIYLTPLRRLRGPPSDSLVFGQFKRIGANDVSSHQKWFGEYGASFRGTGLFCAPRLWTIDPRVINHVLTHSMDYYKPPESHKALGRILGQGCSYRWPVSDRRYHSETSTSRRRTMNPAFGPTQIRELTGVFLAKANELCAYWNVQMEGSGSLRINVMEGLSKMTLDVIGLAGFNYAFEALNTDLPPNELSLAFNEIFKQPPKFSLSSILGNALPSLGIFRDAREKTVDAALLTMQRIGKQILAERKAEILRESSEKAHTLEKKDVQGRDLLTLLIKANMATDVPESQRLSDEEVIAQIPTFLVAGHETTSTSTTWCLYAITRDPSIQQKLREEVFTLSTDTPTMEELNSLPYLDKVIHETLRLHAPVTGTNRIATKDDVLPVSQPYTDRHGNVCTEIPIAKGDRILIPIIALHTSKEIWGEDVLEFKPERWDSPPETIANVPGVWGHLMTFLGGPHACIGYRFSLVEMKALVYTLVRNFEFEFAVPSEDLEPFGLFLQRPRVRTETEKGAQLPLIIRPCKRM